MNLIPRSSLKVKKRTNERERGKIEIEALTMAFEIPLDQIKQLQVVLRKDINLSCYEPDEKENEDPSSTVLTKLPSVAETIASLDPSPPNLRCKNCNGKLLRGLHSSICIFCASNPHKDLLPDPIKFKDTVGYRYLLDSLRLDGSEMVGPIPEVDESNRGRSASKDEIPLSELLDLEIRPPSQLDELNNSAAFQSKYPLNLAAVDLDSFWDQRKSASDAFEEQWASDKQVDNAGENTLQANENLSLFQNAQVPESATGSTEERSGNSFSGWEANFQSASSGAVREESKLFDHSAVDLDDVFGSGKASLGVKKNDHLNRSASAEDDWFSGDIGRSSNSEVAGQTGKPEVAIDPNYAEVEESGGSSFARNFEWMHDDQRPENLNKTTDVVTTDQVADSFDDWDAFTSFASAQGPSTSVSNLKITSQTGESETKTDLNDTKTADDWDDFTGFSAQGPSTSVSNMKITSQIGESEMNADLNDTKTADDWDGFTGFASAQGPSGSVSNSNIASQVGESEMIADLNNTKTAEDTFSSLSTKNLGWMPDNHWQGSNNKEIDNVTTNDVADSINAWDDFMGSASTHDPLSSSSKSMTTSQTGKSEITSDLDITKMTESTVSSSTMNFDWMGDDQWQGNNNSKTTDVVTTDEVSDSFDDWNDFTSSATTQDPSSNVWKQTVNQTSSAEKTSEMDIFNLTSHSHDMNFGGFKQHDLFSEQFTSPLSSVSANFQQSGASSGRVANVDETGGESGDVSSAKLGSNVDDVETILSQMHDLSFMLESKLSVPPK